MISKYPKDMLVYIDESGIDQNIRRKFARALKGQKVYGQISGKRTKRQSIYSFNLSSALYLLLELTCLWLEHVDICINNHYNIIHNIAMSNNYV